MHPVAALFTFAAMLFGQAAAGLPGPAFPWFESPAALDAACRRNLAAAEASIERLERRATGPRWLDAYDDLNALIEDFARPVYLISNVHPHKGIRDAAEACELRWQDLLSRLGQNERLYRAARRSKPRDALDRQTMRLTLESFEDSGVGLLPARRARAKAIADRVTELGQRFDRNIRDENTRLAFTEAELQGVPDAIWRDAPRDAQGRVLLGVDYPTSVPVLQNAHDAATRERIWRAKTNEGGPANLKLLGEIGQLRREYAQLFGYASYADFTLRRRMAENTANVRRFLDEVRGAVTEREKRELAELREAKARDLGQPLDAVRLERWDVAYYTERVRRERYHVDQELFRPYLPPHAGLALVMRVVERMMGVRYTRVEGVSLWHPDVQAYVANDVATGRALATLYVDPYPREGKYNHAAVWPIRSASTRLNRAPQAALVVNLDRRGLSLEEMETLLHEFGHAVQNNLSTTRHTAGASVLRDFVEAPSQMLENWVYDPRVMALLREVCADCRPVPDAFLAQARVAERYGKGAHYARQMLFARFDLALHDADAPEPLPLWQRMEGATPLGHVPGTMLPAGFSHVAGGYAAGYYGYLWSEVVAADLRTAFTADKLDPTVGRRYRDTLLANAGQWPPQVLLRRFLGRDSSPQAFFDDLGR